MGMRKHPTDYGRHRAAFINAIWEEGTKDEAVEWLQKTWDENCDLRSLNAELAVALEQIYSECKDGPSEALRQVIAGIVITALAKVKDKK